MSSRRNQPSPPTDEGPRRIWINGVSRDMPRSWALILNENRTLMKDNGIASKEISLAEEGKKEGQVMKYKNFLQGWGSRYFKLDRSYLHYFESKHAYEPVDSLPRGAIFSVKPSVAFPDRQCVFEIQHKSGTVWYAQADSMEEMLDWIRVLSPVPVLINPQMYPMTTVPGSTQQVQHPPPAEPSPAAPTAPHVINLQDRTLYPNVDPVHERFYGGQPIGPVTVSTASYPDTPPPPYSEYATQSADEKT